MVKLIYKRKLLIGNFIYNEIYFLIGGGEKFNKILNKLLLFK